MRVLCIANTYKGAKDGALLSSLSDDRALAKHWCGVAESVCLRASIQLLASGVVDRGPRLSLGHIRGVVAVIRWDVLLARGRQRLVTLWILSSEG